MKPGQIAALQDLADEGVGGVFARSSTDVDDHIEELIALGYAEPNSHIAGTYYTITLAGHRALSRAMPRRAA